MHHSLPEAFIHQMQRLLGASEAERFLASFNHERAYGLRLNPLKIGAAAQPAGLWADQFGLQPVPWCPTGFYYAADARPGKHPYYAAGLYYIQEPSAMTPAELLDPQPGETILDMAAAPGGKTTQIAGKMAGRGLLVANEIHPARAKILSENVERAGIASALVTSAAPDELSRRFPGLFDRIMLDAPCSGEGMFRKDENAIAEWSEAHVQMCAERQADILEHAAVLLKPGGRLVYSTCTFNRLENEAAMEAFCNRHPEFMLVKTERIWPHTAKGEGHFAAVLEKAGQEDSPASADAAARADKSGRKQRPQRGGAGTAGELAADMALFHAFARSAVPGGFEPGPGEPIRFGDALYWLPYADERRRGPVMPEQLQGLKVLRPGLHLGDIRKNRLEPSHALALALPPNAAAWTQSYGPDAPEIAAYLRGETLPAADGQAGWGLVAVDGFALGWGKASGGQIKNHLPKGLRWPG